MIRVVVVDDHQVVRSGLVSILDCADDIELLGTASNGAEAIDQVIALQPDVVLMDLSMPVVDGIAATRQIVENHPAVRILIVTSFGDDRRVASAIAAGATGYVLKDIAPERLVDAVRSVAVGEVPLDPRVAMAVFGNRATSPLDELSDREIDVLRLVGDGLPNKTIAIQLDIAEKTVKSHLTKIFRTIGVTDRTQAALWVNRNETLR